MNYVVKLEAIVLGVTLLYIVYLSFSLGLIRKKEK